MSPITYKIIYKKIHPPEADVLAGEYGKAAKSVLHYGMEIERVMSELNCSWEGEQRDRFMDSSKNIPVKAKNTPSARSKELKKDCGPS